jgi:hypothetical protein
MKTLLGLLILFTSLSLQAQTPSEQLAPPDGTWVQFNCTQLLAENSTETVEGETIQINIGQQEEGLPLVGLKVNNREVSDLIRQYQFVVDFANNNMITSHFVWVDTVEAIEDSQGAKNRLLTTAQMKTVNSVVDGVANSTYVLKLLTTNVDANNARSTVKRSTYSCDVEIF